MKYDDLKETVLNSEENCVKFLRSFGIFNEYNVTCPRVADSMRCNVPLVRKKKDGRLGWRCSRGKCRSFHSIRKTNKFFTYRTRQGKCRSNFKLAHIIRITYYYITAPEMKLDNLQEKTGYSRQALVDWHSMIREVCSLVLPRQPKLEGSETNPIRVDGALFRGKRKSNEGRLRLGDKKSGQENNLPERESQLIRGESQKVSNNRNHGNRISGPWVVAFHESWSKVRYELVDNRSSETLMPLFHKHVQEMSWVVTDEWKGYLPLLRNEFLHWSVNHSRNLVDPWTKFHTQAVERAWIEGKEWMRRTRFPKLHFSHIWTSYYGDYFLVKRKTPTITICSKNFGMMYTMCFRVDLSNRQ